MLSEPQPVDCPSERGRNYTPPEGSVLRPAGASCGKRMIARSVPAPANHHRGSYTSPALAAASYPFVDLPPGNTLRCKLFPFSKFIQIQSQLHFSRLFSNRLIAWSSLLHYIVANEDFELIKVGRYKRATKESFEKWYHNQTRYQLAEDRQERS